MLIAIAEQEEASQEYLERHLKRLGFESETHDDSVAVLTRLDQGRPPRVLIMRWNGEAGATTAFCQKVRAAEERAPTHVIVTAEIEAQQAVLRAMSDGEIDDVIWLPLAANNLEARMIAARRALALREKLDQTAAVLEAQTMKDGLTGLWSRAASIAFLRRELAISERDGSPVGVALLALRDLAMVNRESGHEAGDALLRQTADVLRTSVRTTDWAGRFSGSKVLLILPGCSETRTESVAARLSRSLDARLSAAAPAGYRDIRFGSASVAVAGEGDLDFLIAKATANLDQPH